MSNPLNDTRPRCMRKGSCCALGAGAYSTGIRNCFDTRSKRDLRVWRHSCLLRAKTRLPMSSPW